MEGSGTGSFRFEGSGAIVLVPDNTVHLQRSCGVHALMVRPVLLVKGNLLNVNEVDLFILFFWGLMSVNLTVK